MAGFAIVTEDDVFPTDESGAVYHFHERYASILQPGTQIIYYKPRIQDLQFLTRRMDWSAHYFAQAEIGRVQIDSNDASVRVAAIENYQPFAAPVLVRRDGRYLEHFPPRRGERFWSDEVRATTQLTFDRIVSLSQRVQRKDR